MARPRVGAGPNPGGSKYQTHDHRRTAANRHRHPWGPTTLTENTIAEQRTVTAAQSALIVENLPIVGYQVSELILRVPPTVTRDELASAGFLALVLAARSYDATTGVPFARYASLRVRGALIDELRSMDWATRGARARARELQTVTDRLAATLGRMPERAEVAAAMGTDTAGVDQARSDLERRVLSIDVPDSPVGDLVHDGAPTPEEALLVREQVHWLGAAVGSLPERLRTVIVGLYLEDRELVDIADELGVTPSRISQLRTEALGLLRDGLNAALDPDLLRPAERPDGVAERRRQAYYAQVSARAVGGIVVPAAGRVVPARTA